jgi:hypothetical protein
MLNAYSPVHYNAFAFICFSTLAEYDKCSPLLYICCSEGECYSEVLWRYWLVLGVRNPSPLPVMFGAVISRIKRKSLIIFLFLMWYCFFIHLFVTICMKLDLGMHIGLHLVFFGKSGVTVSHMTSYLKQPLWRCWPSFHRHCSIISMWSDAVAERWITDVVLKRELQSGKARARSSLTWQ